MHDYWNSYVLNKIGYHVITKPTFKSEVFYKVLLMVNQAMRIIVKKKPYDARISDMQEQLTFKEEVELDSMVLLYKIDYRLTQKYPQCIPRFNEVHN